ncbi:MAG: hypothetical protein Q8M66_05620, partial [Actinomycetota bacterium]|nr:hypothetical protein [Actinomycetota bacterium]
MTPAANNAIIDAGTAITEATAAQTAAAAASTAVTTATTTATIAANEAATASTQAGAAQTAASTAATAVGTATTATNDATLAVTTAQTEAQAAQTAYTNANAAVTDSTNSLATVTSNASIISTNAPVAAYNNPAVATPDRFVGMMSTVQPDTVGGSGYIEGYGPGAGFTGTGTANTSFVLDGTGNLVEKRHAWYEETPASSSNPQLVIADANVKRTGGVAAETFKMPDNSIYAGRWEGGTITVSDNQAINPIPTFSRNLGLTSEHWAIMLAPNVPLPTAGVYPYNKVAATSPTDVSGNVGVLNS